MLRQVINSYLNWKLSCFCSKNEISTPFLNYPVKFLYYDSVVANFSCHYIVHFHLADSR